MKTSGWLPVEIVLAPAVVRFASEQEPEAWLEGAVTPSEPAFLAYLDSGRWYSRPLAPHKQPQDAARELVDEAARGLLEGTPSELLITGGLTRPVPQKVGFIEPEGIDDPLRLVYTVPGPVSSTELPQQHERRWLNLHAETFELPYPSEVRDLVRDHWRQSLEETTAGLDLLPRYFTMSQLLETYQALWQDPDLDWANFQRWVKNNRGMVAEVDPETVREARDETLERLLRTGTAAANTAMIAQTLRALTGVTGVGISIGALGIAGSVLAPPVVAALAATAGALAYQRPKRGRAPQWYQRDDGGTARRLDDLFHPRPTWLKGQLAPGAGPARP